jgi:nicotinate dehydrogenase subunit B
MTIELSRREVGAALSGIVIYFSMVPGARGQAAKPNLPRSLAENPNLDSWLAIKPDGTVAVSPGRVELGQGNTTALAQIAAEELDVGMDRVRLVPVDTAHSPDEGFTAGSNSIQAGGDALRMAAAEARALLLAEAGRRLNAAPERMTVSDGTIAAPGGAKITYWSIASSVSLARHATGSAKPKPASAHRIVGHSVPRLDIPGKVMGRPSYVQDMRLDGMLFGRVTRPPSYRAQLLSVDDGPIRKMPGVVAVVRNGRFLGVVAEREEQAIAAREALIQSAHWTLPSDQPSADMIYDFLQNAVAEAATVFKKEESRPPVAHVLKATYRKPHLAHASIGPACAVAAMMGNTLTIWTHVQGPYPLRQDIAKVVGKPEENVRIIHAQGSGCYGHNGADDAALDAALLSLAADGRPVKLQWMRDDDFGWEPFGSAMVMEIEAGIAADGSIATYIYDVWSNSFNMRPGRPDGVNLLAAWHLAKPFPPAEPRELPLPGGGGDRNAVPTYDFPQVKIVDHFVKDMPIRGSALRTLGGFGNVFATESFIDEAAAMAGADPLEYRLHHLKDDRARTVVQTVAQKAGWKKGAKGDGTRGRGLAFCRYETTKTYVAVVADVVVDRATGRVRVAHVWAAADAGQIVNPDGLENQIEGGIIQGTSWTLKERVKYDRQRILSRDWEGYPILTFPEVPKVDVTLIDRPDQHPLGAGEASQGPTPAAIANAIYHATGARLRDLPFTPDKVRAALKA